MDQEAINKVLGTYDNVAARLKKNLQGIQSLQANLRSLLEAKKEFLALIFKYIDPQTDTSEDLQTQMAQDAGSVTGLAVDAAPKSIFSEDIREVDLERMKTLTITISDKQPEVSTVLFSALQEIKKLEEEFNLAYLDLTELNQSFDSQVQDNLGIPAEEIFATFS